MTSLRKLAAEDPEVATFRIANDRAIQELHPRSESTRRRALHVTAFVAGDDEFCARRVLVRWWRGDSREFTTLIQRDGKFREQKWHEQFEKAGIVVAYQPEYVLGRLVGHPDWVLDWGHGPRVVDLTGQDRRLDFVVLARFAAMKKRQVALYNVMADLPRGFVLAEDKASCEYKMIAVERDQKVEENLVLRVGLVSQVVDSLGREPSEMDIVRAMRLMPRCGGRACRWCRDVQDHRILEEVVAVPDTLRDLPACSQTAPDTSGAGEAGAAGVLEADALLELLVGVGEEEG